MVGDEATSSVTSLPVAQVIAALRPRFNVVVGDLSYAGDGSGYYSNGVPTDVSAFSPGLWDTYLGIVGPAAAQSIPWQVGVGNHEMEPLADFGYVGFTTRFPQAYAPQSAHRLTGGQELQLRERGRGPARRQRPVRGAVRQQRLHPGPADRLANRAAGRVPGARVSGSTSSSSASTTACSAPTPRTAPTAGSAWCGRALSTATRLTWWSAATSTPTSAPTRCAAARSPRLSPPAAPCPGGRGHHVHLRGRRRTGPVHRLVRDHRRRRPGQRIRAAAALGVHRQQHRRRRHRHHRGHPGHGHRTTPPTATPTGASSRSTSPLPGSPAARPASWSAPSTRPRTATGSPAPRPAVMDSVMLVRRSGVSG